MPIYVGDLLTATAASVTGKPTPTRTWQWLRGSTAISGATSNTYTVAEADLGANLSVKQIETNAVGVDTATSLTVGPVSTFSPAALFASGEQGAWYEPSPTTAFKSTTDLTPCGVGDACGFLLDQSQGAGFDGTNFTGLGSELVTNGTFDTDVTGWTSNLATTSVTDGEVMVTNDGSGSGIFQDFTTVVGKVYSASVTARAGTATAIDLRAYVGGGFGTLLATDTSGSTTNVSLSVVFTATSTSSRIYLRGATLGGTSFWDNASVRELAGNHATQATLASRPTLQQTVDGLYYLDFDGVDDGFSLSYPAGQRTANMQMVLGVEQDPATTLLQVFLTSRDGSNNPYVGLYQDGGTSSSVDTGSGTPTHHVNNGSDLALRSSLFDALNTSSPVVYEARGFDMTTSVWTTYGTLPSFGLYRTGTWSPSIKFFGLLILGSHTTGELTSAREWMADQIGVTL